MSRLPNLQLNNRPFDAGKDFPAGGCFLSVRNRIVYLREAWFKARKKERHIKRTLHCLNTKMPLINFFNRAVILENTKVSKKCLLPLNKAGGKIYFECIDVFNYSR